MRRRRLGLRWHLLITRYFVLIIQDSTFACHKRERKKNKRGGGEGGEGERERQDERERERVSLTRKSEHLYQGYHVRGHIHAVFKLSR